MLLSGVAVAMTLAALVDPPIRAIPPPPEPIFGGEVSSPGAWPYVVAVSVGSFLCTGTLVSEDVVFTAAHCLDNAPDVSSIFVRRGDNVTAGAPIRVLSYGADPQFCGEESCKEDIHDYGFLVLANRQKDITEFPRVIADQDEWDELMAVQEPITVVGYGLNEDDLTGIKRQVEIPITKFSGSGLEFQAGGMGLDSCQGDSGGPAFARLASGEWVLAGITSRGYTCGKGGFYAVPLGGLCWLHEESGLDIRPPDCEACDCINTDPQRDRGCGCNSDAPPGLLALLTLLIPAALLLRRRRR